MFLMHASCWQSCAAPSLEWDSCNMCRGLAAAKHFYTDQKTGWRGKEDLFLYRNQFGPCHCFPLFCPTSCQQNCYKWNSSRRILTLYKMQWSFYERKGESVWINGIWLFTLQEIIYFLLLRVLTLLWCMLFTASSF